MIINSWYEYMGTLSVSLHKPPKLVRFIYDKHEVIISLQKWSNFKIIHYPTPVGTFPYRTLVITFGPRRKNYPNNATEYIFCIVL